MYNYLDFEKPVADLEGKIIELKKLAESDQAVDVGEEISRLEKRSKEALRDVYKALTTCDGLAGWWTDDTKGESGAVDGIVTFRFPSHG